MDSSVLAPAHVRRLLRHGGSGAPHAMPRRDFVRAGLGALAAPLLHGCLGSAAEPITPADSRLTARPGVPGVAPTLGASRLGLGAIRDGVLYVPHSYSPDRPLPLWVGFHGSGGSSATWSSYHARAEARGFALLAPDSRSHTWDLVGGALGADVLFLDRALAHTFARCRIDPARMALTGFSDGASYALSLGLPNGDLFTSLVAYSPGFVYSPWPHHGEPRIFVSHGSRDAVIPVQMSRQEIVPALRGIGYDVTYREFDGSHEVPAEVSEAALDWFLGTS